MGAWTQLAPGIRVRQSRLFSMNSGVLERDGHVVLVDPGVLPSELSDIEATVGDAETGVTILLTHHHWDHVLGRARWPHADTVGHDALPGALVRESATIDGEARRHAKECGEDLTDRFASFEVTRTMSGQHVTRLGPFSAVLRDAAGHADTQLSAHFPELRLLFAADMLSDIEIPMLEGTGGGTAGGALGAYRRTLETLRPLIEGGAVETLVPGHGSVASVIEARRRLEHDLAYLVDLERGVRACLRDRVSTEKAMARLATVEHPLKNGSSLIESHHRTNIRLALEQTARASSQAPRRVGPEPSPSGRGSPPRANGRRVTRRRRSHAS